MSLNRRRFLECLLAGSAVPVLLRAREKENPFAPFDDAMKQFMEPRGVPGAALAVVKKGRLVYARGYGFIDPELQTPASPDTLFRLASISKPITATGVLLLAQRKSLKLEDRVIDLLPLENLGRTTIPQDDRWKLITIRHLLHHTGGWDRDKSYDPMFRSKLIAEACSEAPPATPAMIIRYMFSQPLDFDPGSRYAYSNFGYCLLGRIIEKASGKLYETFMREEVLKPLGIAGMRLGRTLLSEQARGESHYFANGASPSLFPPKGDRVEVPYGNFCLEAMDAHGGWISSATELAHFAAKLDQMQQRRGLLNANSLKQMYEMPAPPVARKADGVPEAFWYGCGWLVRPVARGANYWHNGSLPGTNTWLVRRADGLSWVALFNKRSEDKALPDPAIDPALHKAANAVKHWPAHDLFRQISNVGPASSYSKY